MMHSLLRFALTIVFAFACLSVISSQNVLSDVDQEQRYIYDRMFLESGGNVGNFHTAIFPYLRADLIIIADSFELSGEMDPIDRHDIHSIRDQNNEFLVDETTDGSPVKVYRDSTNTFYSLDEPSSEAGARKSRHPLFKTFYKSPAHFYEVNVPDFYLRVNPLIRFSGGRETEEGITTFINQRGISLRGGVGKNLFFQTSIYDSQVRYVNFINQFTAENGVVPGVGFYKPYQSSFLKFSDGRDFLIANAYVGFNIGKYVGIQLGHNQHFIGDGIRSLFLSDFSTPFFSLKLNTRIWKFHYQNIFAELAADDFNSVLGTNSALPKKYMAAHYLSYKAGRHLTFGLFETVIFNRPNHQFELQYLNPVILYRTVEGSIGSPDNVMLGLNARWDIKKRISLYGQFILDDILIKEILNGRLGWWGNKFGHQLGVKYINAVGIDHLDLQAEWNQVRPYTYSHYDANANYSHYNQALAHPLGANFNEWIASARYRVSPGLNVQSAIYIINKGEDGLDSVSYGGNIIAPNNLRPDDYGHTIGQGIEADIVYWSSSVQYEISPGLFADFQYIRRNKVSVLAEKSLTTNLFQIGVRLNMARREDVF
ncbi:MAG: capsule assembly Wzi family protein [Bacteroidota bacterium]|nr:capsule assembly Wzi family protein [Bacteroidota bacterium]